MPRKPPPELSTSVRKRKKVEGCTPNRRAAEVAHVWTWQGIGYTALMSAFAAGSFYVVEGACYGVGKNSFEQGQWGSGIARCSYHTTDGSDNQIVMGSSSNTMRTSYLRSPRGLHLSTAISPDSAERTDYMLLLRTESTVSPQKVKLTTNPDGSITVRISDHLEIRTDETYGITQTVYVYDEAVFDLPQDRLEETEQTITEHIPEWWLYASVDHSEPTMEERVSLLEQIIMGGDI